MADQTPRDLLRDAIDEATCGCAAHVFDACGTHRADAALAALDDAGKVIVAARVVAVLRDLIDSDDCWFDHHGGCQAHGYLTLKPGERCPHDEGKDLLLAALAATEEAETQ